MRFNTKKVLAMTLAVLMIFSTFVVTISAETGDAQTGSITPDTSWYDADESEYVLYDAADLLGFMELCKTNEPVSTHGAADRSKGGFWGGKTVKLGADIDLNPGWDATPAITEEEVEGKVVKTLVPPTAAPNVWTPIAYFGGTFDGQGHTISGLYIDYDAPTTNVGMFSRTGNNSMIKNFVLTNSYVYGHLNTNNYLLIGAISGCCIGKIENVYSGAYVFCDVTDTSGAVQYVNIGGISGLQYQAVSNCVFAGKLGVVKSRTDMTLDTRYGGDNQQVRLGGILGNASDGLDGTKHPNVTNCLTLEGYNVMNSGDLGTSFKHAAIIADGAISLATNCVSGAKDTAWLAENGAEYTEWEYNAFLGYVAPKAISAFFDGVITPDTSWYDASKSEYVLYDAADLLGFMELCKTNEPVSTHGAADRTKGGFWGGKTVKLGADIDLNPGWEATPAITEEEVEGKVVKTLVPPTEAPNVWTPIAYFGGTFDGQGHTISGLYIDYDAPTTNVGMFSRTGNNSMIKNFVLTNSYVYGHLNTNNYLLIGAIVGCCIGKIENVYSGAYVFCDVTDTNGAVQYVNIGGISGLQYDTVRNCVFAGKLGVVKSRTDMTLDTRYGGDNQQVRLGGILGNASDALKAERYPNVTNCLTLEGYNVMNSGDLGTSFKHAAIIADGKTDAAVNCVSGAKDTAWLAENGAEYTEWEYNAFLGYVAPKAISAYFSSIRVQEGTGSNAGAVRFIGLIGAANLDDFASISLKITMTYDGKSYVLTENINTVYTSLIANSEPVYAEDLGASYMYAVEVYGLGEAESDVTFTVENVINGSVVDTASWTYSAS